jgi:hypothetical protein
MVTHIEGPWFTPVRERRRLRREQLGTPTQKAEKTPLKEQARMLGWFLIVLAGECLPAIGMSRSHSDSGSYSRAQLALQNWLWFFGGTLAFGFVMILVLGSINKLIDGYVWYTEVLQRSQDREGQTRSSAAWMIGLSVSLLPGHARPRWSEDWEAELIELVATDVSRLGQLRHGLRVLRSIPRLRRALPRAPRDRSAAP